MTTPSADCPPPTLQTIRIVRSALDAGYRDGGLPPPPDTEAKAVAVADVIAKYPGHSYMAVIQSYLAGWAQALKNQDQGQHPDRSTLDWLHAAVAAYSEKPREPSPKANDLPDDYFDLTIIAELAAEAIANGLAAEGCAASDQEQVQLGGVILTRNHTRHPWHCLIKGYFGGRAQAIALRLGREPLEEPDRYYRQAVWNWFQEVGVADQ